MSEPEQAPKQRRVHRSPSYPAINLETALGRAQQLWNAAGRHPAPVSAAVEAFGYGPKSSGGRLALAAMKKFGLIDDEGQREGRQVKLTKLGSELIVYRADKEHEAWKTGIRQAALKPTIHKELWAKYEGDLPSDRVIKPYLVLDREFSDGAADELLKEFRATLAYAGMTDSAGNVSPQDEDNDEDSGEDGDEDAGGIVTPPATIQQEPTQRELKPKTLSKNDPQFRAQRTVQVPYSPTEWALVQAAFPLTEQEWEQMLGVLQAMKLGLVVPPDQD